MSFPAPTERQARVIWLALTGLAFAVLGALVAALIWSLGRLLELLSPVIWPLAVAGILAYLLDPVVDFIEHRGVPRARAIVCGFALAFVIVGALFGSVVPQVITETRQLALRIPGYADSLEKRLEKWINNPPPWVKRWLERETNPSGPSGSQSATNEIPPLSSTNAPPTADATTTEGGPLLGGLLDKESLQTATGWLAKVLPKIGSWLFGQVGRLASWFGVLAGLALVPGYTFYFRSEFADGHRLAGQGLAQDRFVALRPGWPSGFVVRCPGRAGAGSGLHLLFPAGETRHLGALDRLPAGRRLWLQERVSLRAQLHQQLSHRLFPRPGLGGSL